jgi:hypothetical protein
MITLNPLCRIGRDEYLGQRIRALLAKRKWSAKEIAERVHCTMLHDGEMQY